MIHRYEVIFTISPTIQFTRISNCYYTSPEELAALNPRLFKRYGLNTRFKVINSKPKSTIYNEEEYSQYISHLTAYYSERSDYASYEPLSSGF